MASTTVNRYLPDHPHHKPTARALSFLSPTRNLISMTLRKRLTVTTLVITASQKEHTQQPLCWMSGNMQWSVALVAMISIWTPRSEPTVVTKLGGKRASQPGEDVRVAMRSLRTTAMLMTLRYRLLLIRHYISNVDRFFATLVFVETVERRVKIARYGEVVS